MTQDFVNKAMRGSNRRLLIWCVVGVALVAIGLGASANYYYNVFSGPFPVSEEQLLNLSDVSGLREYYVTVKGDDVFDTGYQYVETETRSGRETVKANYPALVLGERWLLVKTALASFNTEYTGSLIPISSEVRNEVILDFERAEPRAAGLFLPYMLDTGDFKTSGYIGLGVAGLILLLSFWGILRLAQRSQDPLKHPIMRSIQRLGEPQVISQQINTELAREHPQVSNVHFTPNWIVQLSGTSLNATRPADVVWTYKQVTQRRVNGIPAGKTYAALIWDRHGTCITMPAKENQVNEALASLLGRAPWVVTGYSGDVQKAWQKDRAGFIAAVDERRRKSAVTPQ